MYACVLGANSSSYAEGAMQYTGLRDIKPFSSLSEFLTTASNQHLRLNRVLILINEISPSYDLESLRRYCTEISPKTEVIIISAMDRQNGILDRYQELFPEPIYTDYTFSLNESVTDFALYNIFTMSLDEIRREHSRDKDATYKVKFTNTERSDAPSSESSVSSNTNSSPMANTQQGIIKSFTYGGRFFKRKYYTTQELNVIHIIEQEANTLFSLKGVK